MRGTQQKFIKCENNCDINMFTYDYTKCSSGYQGNNKYLSYFFSRRGLNTVIRVYVGFLHYIMKRIIECSIKVSGLLENDVLGAKT